MAFSIIRCTICSQKCQICSMRWFRPLIFGDYIVCATGPPFATCNRIFICSNTSSGCSIASIQILFGTPWSAVPYFTLMIVSLHEHRFMHGHWPQCTASSITTALSHPVTMHEPRFMTSFDPQQHTEPNFMQYQNLVGVISWISSIAANGTTFCAVPQQRDVSVVVMNNPLISTSLLWHRPPQHCLCEIAIWFELDAALGVVTRAF